jgi:hypothetical protein
MARGSVIATSCPQCGEPLEERFRLCPACGLRLRGSDSEMDSPRGPAEPHGPTSAAGEFFEEVVGLDRRVLRTLGMLFRDPAAIATDATNAGPSRYARPLRIYLVASFLSLVFFGVVGWVVSDPDRPEAPIPPDELSLSIDLNGPRIDAGEAVLQAIADAGGVDEWLAATGRLQGRALWFRIVATRALRLRYEARFEEVQSSFAQNEALISLLLIPVATLLFALLYFRSAPLRGHMSLVALLVALGLFLAMAHQMVWLVIGTLGLAGPGLFFVLLAARPLVLVGYVQLATRGFYRLGWARSLLTTPFAALGLALGYIGCAWVLNVVFILLT